MATVNMSYIRRSTTGCWTCRARRKKCDESGFPCSICQKLRLTCHGYGQRPEWMDGGDQEKAQMAAFKVIVKRTKVQKRRHGSNSISSHTSLRDAAETGTQAHKRTNSGAEGRELSAYAHQRTSLASGESRETLENIGERADSNLEETLEWFQSHLEQHETDFFQPYDALNNGSVPVSNDVDQFWTLPSPKDDGSIHPFTANIMQEFSFDSALVATSVQPTEQQSMLSTPSLETQSNVETSPSPTVTNLAAQVANRDVQRTELMEGDQDAWEYYTGVLLPSMFHFVSLESMQHEFRKVLKACKSTPSCSKHITSETERFQASELRRFGLRSTRGSFPEHESENQAKPLYIYGHFEQRCLLHVLMAQINLGGKEWPSIVDWLSRNTTAAQKICEESSIMRSILCHIEVLASTIMGVEPRLATHQLATIDKSIDAGFITGVEPCLLDCLIRVVRLRKWKSEQLAQGSLSIFELIKRSVAIRDDLDEDHNCNVTAKAAFMNVFRSGIAVFLQCIVSEPRPDIAEIQQEVSKTISALQNLPEALLLKRLGWPVCIAASMARDDQQQEFFKTLAERLKYTLGPHENIYRGLLAAFECWRLRENATMGRTYDWTDGMKSLGHFGCYFELDIQKRNQKHLSLSSR